MIIERTAVGVDGELRGVVLGNDELLALTAEQLREAIKTYGLIVIRCHHEGAPLYDLIDPGVTHHEEYELADVHGVDNADGSFLVLHEDDA